MGRARVAEDITDAELAARDQMLARWRPSWPSLGKGRRGYKGFWKSP
jgi:hypothetical protein